MNSQGGQNPITSILERSRAGAPLVDECSVQESLSRFALWNWLTRPLQQGGDGHAFLEPTRAAYREELADSVCATSSAERALADVEKKLERLVELYATGQIDPEILDRKAESLNAERARLMAECESLRQLSSVVEYAADQVTDESIRGYVDRFEDLLSEDNRDLMREFLEGFVDRVELHRPKNGRRRPRKVCIHGKMPEFTRIELASRTGH